MVNYACTKLEEKMESDASRNETEKIYDYTSTAQLSPNEVVFFTKDFCIKILTTAVLIKFYKDKLIWNKKVLVKNIWKSHIVK